MFSNIKNSWNSHCKSRRDTNAQGLCASVISGDWKMGPLKFPLLLKFYEHMMWVRTEYIYVVTNLRTNRTRRYVRKKKTFKDNSCTKDEGLLLVF